MDKKKSTLLERLIERSFPINLIYEAKKNGYTQPIANLILSSQSIAERATKDWTYKNLAEFGEEEFINSAHAFDKDGRRSWVEQAILSFSECVYRQAWYEENEGLIFYVQEDGKFRPARPADSAYDFICRLRDDQGFSGITFTQAPNWANELYIYRPNYMAYCLIWNDCSSFSDPRYEASKKAKANAVIQETTRLAGKSEQNQENRLIFDEKPLLTTERNTLLSIIAALCDYSNIKHQDRGAAGQIAKLTEEIGVSVTDDTIRKVLKKIPDVLETRMK